MNTKQQRYALAAVISLVTLAVYLPALRNEFLEWDDMGTIVNNIHIRSLNGEFFTWAFSDLVYATYWHPIAWISHAIDYALWGLNPFGHHLTSIILHAINSFVVVLLAVKLVNAGKGITAHSGPSMFPNDRLLLIAAATTGLLFGLHPMQVEAVAWASDKKELLYSLFFLSSLLAYLDYAIGRKETDAQTGPGTLSLKKPYLLALGLFALSLASKPMAVTLPAVLLILDWYPARRLRSSKDIVPLFAEKIPFWVLSFAVSIITVLPQKAEGTLPTLERIPLTLRILVAAKALALYLWKIVMPFDLSPLYPYPKHATLLSFEYLSAVALVTGISVACMLAAKKHKIWPATWGAYCITLLPVLGIIQVGYHSRADRFTYLPGIGPFLLLGLAAAWTWEKAGSLHRAKRIVKGLAVVASLVLCLFLSFLTVKQLGVWRTTITLWSAVIEREPDRVPLAYLNRGIAFAEQKQFDRALDDFNKTILLDPQSALAYNNRGRVYRDQGQVEKAFGDFTKALELDPRNYLAYNNRGLAFKAMGRTERAIEDFSAALAANPDYAEAYSNRGIVYGENGQLDRAVGDFTAAIKVNPYYADAYTGRGLAFAMQGDLDRAIQDYDKAAVLQPADYLAFSNRGIALAQRGQLEKAIEDFTRAIALKPDSAETYLERGRIYQRSGKTTLAAIDYRKACEIGESAGCSAMRALQK